MTHNDTTRSNGDAGVTAYEAEVARTTSRPQDIIAPHDPKPEMGHVEAQNDLEHSTMPRN
jgi:hypothetical protein